MKHHIIKSLFTLLVAACLPAVASAQNFMSGGIGYHVLSSEDHTVEVTGKESCTPYSGNINIYTLGGRIVVEGADGETVRIYDITGRSVLNSCLPTGVYLVIVGDRTTKKVVVLSDSY